MNPFSDYFVMENNTAVLIRLNQALTESFGAIRIFKKADMAQFLGYKSPYFSGIINGKEDLTPAFLKRISEKLEINEKWVLTGEGEMLRELRQSHEQRPNTPEEVMKESEINAISIGKVIPYFDAEAAAGYSYGVSTEPSRPVGMIEIGGLLKDSESALRVYGNSMTPNYPSGCVVGTKLHTDSFIEPGSVYLVETRDNRYLKRLYYNDDKTAFRCVSDNHMTHESGPMKGHLYYPEFEIPYSEVIRLHRVTGVIKRNIL